MRIAVVVTEYPKATETFIYRDLVTFAAMGHEVRLYPLAPLRRNQPLHGFAEPTRAMVRDIPLLGLGGLFRTLATRPLALVRAVARMAWAYRGQPKLLAKSLALVPKALAIRDDARGWGADHVHAEFAGHPATTAWLGRRTGGVAYSVSCRAHDIFRTQALLDAKLGEAGAVRTVSGFGMRFLKERVPGLAGRTLHVIHSSVPVASIPASDPPADGVFRILYVGALEPKKGVEHLIDALAIAGGDLGEWRCDLYGHGPSADALRARAAPLGARLVFHGAQPFEHVAAAYAEASVCVAPSVIGPDGRQEGIPNVMIEALAYRRPAITTAISGIPELIEDGVTGLLVPPGDAAALAAALRGVRDDPAAAAAMAARGRMHVEAEFDLAANAARQVALFSECGNEASSASPATAGVQ